MTVHNSAHQPHEPEIMTTTARNERQARLVANKLARGEKRVTTWIPGDVLDRLRETYPTDLHGAPDWKRIAEAALKLADQEREGNP